MTAVFCIVICSAFGTLLIRWFAPVLLEHVRARPVLPPDECLLRSLPTVTRSGLCPFGTHALSIHTSNLICSVM